MVTRIGVRPLTNKEEMQFRETKLGRKASSLSKLAIIGNEASLEYEDVREPSRIMDLGSGRYVDLSSRSQAKGGRFVTIHWAAEHIYNLLMGQGVEFVYESFMGPNTMYFERIYADSVLDNIIYIDQALTDWQNRRSLIDKLFGGAYPSLDTASQGVINQKVRNRFASVRIEF